MINHHARRASTGLAAGTLLPMAIALCMAVFPAQLHGALVAAGLFTPGDDGVTRDTDTMLEWLDLTLTEGIPAADVQTGTFVQTHGFRFATDAELRQLFINAGLPGFDSGGSLSLFPDAGPADNFLGLFGITADETDPLAPGFLTAMGWHSAWSITPPVFTVGSTFAHQSWVQVRGLPGSPTGAASLGTSQKDPPLTSSQVGSFLVRTYVPEPASLHLLAIATLIGLSRRRKRM